MIVMPSFQKRADAILDYKFDFAPLTNGTGKSDWVTTGETISNFVVTAPDGIVVESATVTDNGTSVTIWLSGGTEYEDYPIACLVTTSENRTDGRTLVIRVRPR